VEDRAQNEGCAGGKTRTYRFLDHQGIFNSSMSCSTREDECLRLLSKLRRSIVYANREKGKKEGKERRTLPFPFSWLDGHLAPFVLVMSPFCPVQLEGGGARESEMCTSINKDHEGRGNAVGATGNKRTGLKR
jgi:hypothetical protein